MFFRHTPSAAPTNTTTQEITISLPGNVVNTILVTDQGKSLKKNQITSSDGNITLTIDQGIALLNNGKQPLQSINAMIDTAIPLPPENAQIIGDVVDIQPADGAINPAIKLTLKYDPSTLPQGANENDLGIYNYTGSNWELVRYKNIDTKASQITTIISRFGEYSTLLPLKPAETTSPGTQTIYASTDLLAALQNGKPTFAEFGSSTCIPCKQMRGIIEQMALDYKDKMNVVIIEVYEQREVAPLYQIMTIPTQIIFNTDGNEITRHIGVLEREQIEIELKKAGIP